MLLHTICAFLETSRLLGLLVVVEDWLWSSGSPIQRKKDFQIIQDFLVWPFAFPEFAKKSEMNDMRINLIEEDNFQNSEISTLVENSGIQESKSIASLMANIVISYASIAQSRITSGMAIQNVSKHSSIGKGVLWFILLLSTVAGERGFVEKYLPSISHVFVRLSRSFQVILLCLFLSGVVKDHRLPNVLAQVRTSNLETSTQRVVSTELVSRYLVLQSLTSIAILVIPMYNVKSLFSRMMQKILPSSCEKSTCSSCRSDTMVLPILAQPCGDVYCYYCINSEILPFNCYRCNERITCFISAVS